TALGATVLYAVGAGAVSFAVEQEEETQQFLNGLPTRWLPMTAAKLATTACSAVLLAAALTMTGWAFPRGPFATQEMAAQLRSILGFGILEAIGWGTLFSLLVKRPLAAAGLA